MSTYQFNTKEIRTIEKMAKEGKTYTEICEKIFGWENYTHYKDIQDYCRESQCYGWIGSKKIVNRRLSDLKRIRLNKEDRNQKIDEIRWFTDYLYYCGRDLQKKLDRIKDIIE